MLHLRPPEPAITPKLLVSAAQLYFFEFARTPEARLGELRTAVGTRWLLTFTSGASSRMIVEWALVEHEEGLPAIPVLLTMKAGEVLTRGKLEGKVVRLEGERYRLRLLWASDPRRMLYADAVEA